MKKREPKPMKPVKAWACVDKDTGKIGFLQRQITKRQVNNYRKSSERIARVENREVLHEKQ